MATSATDHGTTDRRLTVCVTFDNLGEAAEIEFGLLPDDVATGSHPSVTKGLPSILELLLRHDVPGTFFIEGWNGERYPDAIAAISAAGHEVGLHGWRHENWSQLGASDADRLAGRSLDALRGKAVPCVGMRPPGGSLTSEACRVLAGRGIEYVSPLPGQVDSPQGLVMLPFEWKAVDALYFEPTMSSLRASILGDEDVQTDVAWADGLTAVLHDALDRGGLLTVIFHAYLLADHPGRVAILADFLRTCSTHPRIVTERMVDVARRSANRHDA